MVDVHTKEQRSRNMAAILSRGNKKTEVALLRLLRENKITGWRRHYKNLPGTPDFVFIKARVAIFVDGCFWHGCTSCDFNPRSNWRFWANKIKGNKERDRRVNKDIAGRRWKVLRIWEHQIQKNPEKVIGKIENALKSNRPARL